RTPQADDWPRALLHRVDVDTGDVRQTDRKGAAEFAPHFSPDGQWIAHAVTDSPPTWAGAARVRRIPANGTKTWTLADTHDGWGRYSEIIGWSAEGKGLVYFTEVHGTVTRVGRLPLEAPP